jgi:DASH complex subunit ASK1
VGSDYTDAPWGDSLESPLVRLGRDIQSLTQDEEGHQRPASVVPPPSLDDISSINVPREKGKAKAVEPDADVIRDGLLQALRESRHKPLAGRRVSPLKVKPKPKTPIPKTLNPYLPLNADPRNWSGIVDLHDPTLVTPRPTKFLPPRGFTPRTIIRKPVEESMDDSFVGLPPGMSPPRMMSPAAPPRSSAALGLLTLAQSPIKDAAERIKRDLLSDVQKQSGGSRLLFSRGGQGSMRAGTESSMSTMPTPPSLSRYTQHHGAYGFESAENSASDPTFESMMHRIGLDAPANDVHLAEEDLSLVTPLPQDADADSDSDSDSDSDEIHDTAHPSDAFLVASQQAGQRSFDDSDDSMNQSFDSLDGEGAVPIMAGAYTGDDFDDDSFDAVGDVEEETVFGLPPAQREARFHAQRQEQLRMMGAELMEDTTGIGRKRSATGVTEETPTPWGRISHG